MVTDRYGSMFLLLNSFFEFFFSGDQDHTVKYPTAALSSATFDTGSFDCWFNFWYYMYDPDTKDNNDGTYPRLTILTFRFKHPTFDLIINFLLD